MKRKSENFLWIWSWAGMGYNSCWAPTKAEAIQKAEEMAKGTTMVLLRDTVHRGTVEELTRLASTRVCVTNGRT